MPEISVIIPAYNRCRVLPRAVESVLAQTFRDWEVLIVDDASTEKTDFAEIIVSDPRIRFLQHAENRGPAAARNTGLAAAHGEFIAFLDSDDEWLPEKLERQIAFLKKSEADLCFCHFLKIAEFAISEQRQPANADWKTRLHWTCGLGGGTTLLARKNCFEKAGGLDETLRVFEDWEWIFRAVEKASARIAILSEPLAKVYVGGSRNSTVVESATLAFLKKHDAAISANGAAHRRFVHGKHFEYLAAAFYHDRKFARANHYLLKSFAKNPRQNPIRLAAIPLSIFDGIFGTSLLQKISDHRAKSAFSKDSEK